MKKLNLLIALLAIAMIGFMSSCTKDAVGPTIVLTADGLTADATLDPGESFTLAWSIQAGDAKLASLTITKNDINVTGYPDEDIPTDNYVGSADLTADPNEGSYVYKVIVTDKDGLTDEKSVTITVEQSGTPLTTEVTTGEIGHYFGPLDGAWDLVADESLKWVDPETGKDMKNSSAASGSDFISGFKAGNSTMFVKDNTVDYDNVTEEAAAAAYDAGTAASSIATVAVDDIVIAKLRGGSDYAVIKITVVDPSAKKSTLAGSGKINFTYKK